MEMLKAFLGIMLGLLIASGLVFILFTIWYVVIIMGGVNMLLNLYGV